MRSGAMHVILCLLGLVPVVCAGNGRDALLPPNVPMDNQLMDASPELLLQEDVPVELEHETLVIDADSTGIAHIKVDHGNPLLYNWQAAAVELESLVQIAVENQYMIKEDNQ